MRVVCIDPAKPISVNIICSWLGRVHRSDNCAQSFARISIFHIAVSLLAATSFARIGIEVESDLGVLMF